MKAMKIGRIDLANRTPTIGEWYEAIGVVMSISNSSVTLRSMREITLRIGEEEMSKWSHLLQPEKKVAILKMDDGSIRVRVLDQTQRGE